MDPVANLKEQLELASKIQATHESDAPTEFYYSGYYDDVDRLTELVISLNEWIMKGGYIPSSWNK